MLNKANITWNVKQIVKMMNKGNITCENAVQRGYEWSVTRASLFIHSLITGYPIPPFYARKTENGMYDMLDGKQRLTTLKRFFNNEFALKDVPVACYTVDGTEMEVDINDCKYENLVDDFRDELDSASLTIYYFDSITDDEIAEMFFRLNNGKAVSSGTLTRVKALSKEKIKELGQHPIFSKALTQKALEAYTNEDMVIKALYILSGGDNLETKNVRKWISETEITDDDYLKLHGCLSVINEAVSDIEVADKKLAKKILTKTHLLSILPMIQQSREDKTKIKIVEDILMGFFGTEDRTSISDDYNEACMTGANKVTAVTTRLSEIKNYYWNYKEKKEDAA